MINGSILTNKNHTASTLTLRSIPRTVSLLKYKNCGNAIFRFVYHLDFMREKKMTTL